MIPILWLDEVSSTNKTVKEQFLSENRDEMFAVAARRQTAGRGRLGRTWESEPGQSLALSILVPRALPAAVTLAVGVAVSDAVFAACGEKTAIKWPNDILCNNRKIGGILCEGIVGDRRATVLGIGINLAQPASFFEKNGLPYGGSLRSETGADVLPEMMASAVCASVEKTLKTLETSGFAALRSTFEERCITLGKPVQVLSPSGEPLLDGTARGVDDDGNLSVADRLGELHAVGAGEVSVRGVYGYV